MSKKSIVILTTKTDHHTYFINKIFSAGFHIAGVIYENEVLKPVFNTISPYSEKEKIFEEKNFFLNIPDKVYSQIKIFNVGTLNGSDSENVLKKLNADVGIVFGCGKIQPHVFLLAKKGLINVHRGIAEEYRGLDCDLWPIYHVDYKNIGVTIHKINKRLDTGDILYSQRLKLVKNMKIYELRYYTTIIATDLVIKVLKDLESNSLRLRKQRSRGRYYSFMPSSLKMIVERRFNTYCEKLN